MHSRLPALLAVAVLLTAGLVSCTPDHAPSVRRVGGEPIPSFSGPATSVGRDGGQVERDGVRVEVPRRASATAVGVSVGSSLGRSTNRYATETFGIPIRIDHRAAIDAPITLRWRIPADLRRKQSAPLLVRWNESARAWVPSDERVSVVGGEFVARVQQFSTVTWTALGQEIGEILGKRINEPDCSRPVPSWVRTSVDSDGGETAFASLMCFEGGEDGTVDVRVGNNRTFSQRIDLDSGADRFATTWDGDPGFSVENIIYSAARAALSGDGRFLIPPGQTIAVGLSRPSRSGLQTIEGHVRVDASTVLADVLAQSAGSLSISAGENPLLSAAVQALYECGGKQLAQEGPDLNGPRLAVELAGIVGDCATELTRPDSEFGARFETLSRRLIAKAGLSQRAAIAANRAARGLTAKMAIIRSGEIALQISDVWANAVVGPGRWSVTGYGVPPKLGDWTASCSSISTDSDRLFKNLTLQDDFTSSSEDYWRIRSWSASAKRAVQPLKTCGDEYQERLASFLPGDWADGRSAEVVARRIRDLTATPRTPSPVLAAPWAPNQEGYGEKRPSTVYNGGDPTGLVRNITWRSWGGGTAVGDGESCRTPPGGFTVDCTMKKTVIIASDLGTCDGVAAYRDVGWYVPELDDKTERSAMGDVVQDCTND